jgi:very-short-patch-repair endonuclease
MGDHPPHANSDFERDFPDFCTDFGLPQPELNATVAGFVVDALWRDRRVVAELDSYGYHRSRRAFESDRERDAALQLARYRVVRITWRRLTRHPAEVAMTIRALLEAGVAAA